MSTKFFRLLVFLIAVLPSLSLAQTTPADVTLVIGVRADARPFSYKVPPLQQAPSAQVLDGPLGAKGYGGYVVGICDAVLLGMQRNFKSGTLTIEVKEVDAQTRFTELALPSDGIDILCDPATLTDSRLALFMASAPIYLSGITFATQVSVPFGVPCAAIIGVVGDTTSADLGIRKILQSGNLAVFSDELQAFSADPTAWETARAESDIPCQTPPGITTASSEQQPAILYAKTHNELAAAFCQGNVLHYLGDIEIVNRHLRSIRDCGYADAALTFTEERYAIYARVPPETDFAKAYVILQFYEQLTRRTYGRNSILLRSFEATFPEYQPSQKLQAFYWSIVGDFPGSSR